MSVDDYGVEGLLSLDDDHIPLEDLNELSDNEESIEKLVSPEEKSEAARWAEKSWEQQWKEVMSLLADGRARWDNSVNSNAPLLDDYKKDALTKRDIRDKTTPTILHMLAKSFEIDGFKDVPRGTILKIIGFLLQHQESESANNTGKEPQEDPILKVAMEWVNEAFIVDIIQFHGDRLPDLLDAKDAAGMNALHYAFKEQLSKAMDNTQKMKNSVSIISERKPDLEATVKTIIAFVQKAMPRTIAATDGEGNTPIHYALNYKLCRIRHRVYQNIIRSLIVRGDQVLKKETAKQFNSNGKSPYLYYLQTEKEWLDKLRATERQITKPPDNSDKASMREAKRVAEPQGPSPVVAKLSKRDGEAISERSKRERGARGQGNESSISDMPPEPTEPAPRKEKPLATLRGAHNSTLDPPQRQGPSRHFTVQPSTVSHVGDTNFSKFASQAQALAPPQSNNPVELKALPKGQVSSDQKQATVPKRNMKPSDSRTAAGEIRDLVKLHYIRTRTDMEAKELLYGKEASDKNLYFDATNHKGKGANQVVDLIEKLSKAGGFEDTLSYVSLPGLSHVHDVAGVPPKVYGANEGRQRGVTLQENPKMGRSSLIKVFDKLAAVGVRNILRLHVDDSQSPAHTDASIERAIQGRDYFAKESSGENRNESIDVELWDWRRPDLSIDVIAFAAPKVEHVNLYWSGNQTTLRAWASPEGIARLRVVSDGQLKRVTLHASPGLESRDRTEKVIKQFEDDIEKQTNKLVKIESKIRNGDIMAGSRSDDDLGTSAVGSSESPPHHVWVERMEDFRSALVSIHALFKSNTLTPPRIKVALIDDGVDLSNLNSYNQIVEATGLSYCPPHGRTERAWHESTNGHGTIMANMIVRINPWISLEVMRIQDGVTHSPSGKARTIYADSAAKAIKGAILRKADIISISWTIKKVERKARSRSVANTMDGVTADDAMRSADEIAIDALEDAIDMARANKILIFCSAPDDIQVSGRDTLPYSKASDYIFRIGAALPKGQRDPSSPDTHSINYFFPGNQVAEAWNPRSAKTVEYHDGSSVSTALAAGLASLIMYCANVVKTYHGTMAENADEKTYAFFKDMALRLQNHENMRKAFDNINYKEHEDKKFLPVWDKFGSATEQIKKKVGSKKVDELESLMRKLCIDVD